MEFSLECPGGFLQFLDFHTGFSRILWIFSLEFLERTVGGFIGFFLGFWWFSDNFLDLLVSVSILQYHDPLEFQN